MRPFIVAIDGPSGAGKSTVSRLLSRRLGLSFVDTGALYRTVALSARREGIATADDGGLRALLGRIRISFQTVGEDNRVFLDGADVSKEIRTPEISLLASAVSARPVVREGLLGLQRRLALETPLGAVLEGRDIGTVVFPDADLKFFLEASPEVRARRRYEELFPGVADTSEPEFWAGLRPSTPTNVPYIGRSRIGNLWLNAGHGTLGWTHGAGSGRALAALISGHRPQLEFGFCGDALPPRRPQPGARRPASAAA